MSYSKQLVAEAVWGRHNLKTWVLEEVKSLDADDLAMVTARAMVFLDTQAKGFDAIARVEELFYHFDSKEACATAVANALLETIIMIKPEYLMRGGVETAFPGVSPIQAVATQIGLHLHKNQLDAVKTGLEVLSEFQDIGMYELRFGEDEHGHDTCVVQSNFSGVDRLQSRIKATKYLPPMLVQPQQIL